MNTKEYLDLVNKRRAEKQPVKIPMPSGAVWECLPVDIKHYTLTGTIPMTLVGKLESVKDAPGKALSKKENVDLVVAMMKVTREVMLNNLVFPKVTLEETEDSITPEQIDPEDFEYFMNWIAGGGQAQADSKSPEPSQKRSRAA